MPLEKIRVLSVLVMAAVTSSLIAGEFHALHFLIYLGVTIPLWFDIQLDKVRQLPYWRIFIFFAFVVFVGSRIIGFQFRNTLFLLILSCIVYEYYGEKRPKAPVRLVSLLSFLFMLSQVRQNYGLSLLVSIAIYLVAVVWCLISFHSGGIVTKDFRSLIWQRLYRSLIHATCISAIGLGIFWVIPRLPDQSMAVIGSLTGNRLSGFSDHVSLNDIGTLKLSRKHIMDLTPLDGVLHSNYLKGKVLDLYKNGVWTTASMQTNFLRPDHNDFFQVEEDPPKGSTLRYRIDLEPMQNNTLFFFNDILGFEGKLKHLKIMGQKSATGVNQIQVFRFYPSAISYNIHTRQEASIPERTLFLSDYLQLPANLNYFRPLARRISAQANANSDREKIRAFRNFFLNNFSYSLEINNHDVEDPLREFVENNKRGHCELFASSLVMLLRAEGIPSRLVTGFLVPPRHPAGDFHAITEADAHAWVEVYLDKHWMTVDPTPPATFLERSFFETQVAYLNYLWRTKIILWDADRQSEVLASIYGDLRSLATWFIWDGWRFLIGLALLALTVWIWYWQRTLRKTQYLTQVFCKLDRILQAQFGPKPVQLPWRDWFAGLSLEKNLKGDISKWVADYQSLRFGPSAAGSTTSNQPMVISGKRLTHRLTHLIS